MQDFDCMYSALCVCLDDIARNTDMVWDGSTISEAQGLLHKISSAGFIAAFKVNHHMFGYTKPLSILLQGSTMDVITAYNDIHTVKKILLDMRKDPEMEFKPVFDSMLAMAVVQLECQFQEGVEDKLPDVMWRHQLQKILAKNYLCAFLRPPHSGVWRTILSVKQQSEDSIYYLATSSTY